MSLRLIIFSLFAILGAKRPFFGKFIMEVSSVIVHYDLHCFVIHQNYVKVAVYDLFFLMLSRPYVSSLDNLDSKIIGGQEAKNGMYPYQVQILIQFHSGDVSYFCGGAIVHKEWIVTAAHCLFNPDIKGNTLIVNAGSNKLSVRGDVYTVLETHIHPMFDNTTITNDVAILKVERIVFYAKVSKIKVETGDVRDNVPVTLTGWGATIDNISDAEPADSLRELQLKTITNKLCQSKHKDLTL